MATCVGWGLTLTPVGTESAEGAAWMSWAWAGASRRRGGRAGLTQEEVAAHLGVTKAAVTKWERGRSVPDLALAPKLAALLALSVDEPIGYEPQMPQERIDTTCAALLARFEEDSAAALEAACAEAVRWWSCPALLLALGMLL